MPSLRTNVRFARWWKSSWDKNWNAVKKLPVHLAGEFCKSIGPELSNAKNWRMLLSHEIKGKAQHVWEANNLAVTFESKLRFSSHIRSIIRGVLWSLGVVSWRISEELNEPRSFLKSSYIHNLCPAVRVCYCFACRAKQTLSLLKVSKYIALFNHRFATNHSNTSRSPSVLTVPCLNFRSIKADNLFLFKIIYEKPPRCKLMHVPLQVLQK